MSKVTRWGEDGHSYGDTWMEPTDDGEWVKWEDYGDLTAERDRLADEIGNWRSDLSDVMPADFKDWHQNSPSEWPSIADSVILRLRDREREAWLEVDRLAALSEEWRMECLRQNAALSAALDRADRAEAENARLREYYRASEAISAIEHEWRQRKSGADGVLDGQNILNLTDKLTTAEILLYRARAAFKGCADG